MPLGDDFPPTLAAARTGADWALSALFTEFHPALVRYLRARVGQDAEDVASDAWIDIARSLDGFTGAESDFRAFAFTIARRRSVDHLRRASRRPTLATDDVDGLTLVRTDSAEDAALHGRLGDESARRIVAHLPSEQAEIVLLRVVAGLSVDEVADLLGRRPGTIRVMQHRALKRLAKRLQDEL